MLSTLALLASLTLPAGSATPPDTLAPPVLSPAAVLQPRAAPLTMAARPVSLASQITSPLASRPDEEPQLIEYSDAYFTRLTIHKWASYLTVPLFVSQYIVGQKLMNGEGTDRLRSIHGALAAGVGGLFVVNTITGGLNAIEARKDPAEKNRRTLHSALMLLADAGFVATGMLAKENEGRGLANNRTHRDVALASMATALLGYVIMLPPFRKD